MNKTSWTECYNDPDLNNINRCQFVMVTNTSWCANNTETNTTYCNFKYEKNITRCNRDKDYMVQNNTISLLGCFANTSVEKYDDGNLYSFHLFNLNFT